MLLARQHELQHVLHRRVHLPSGRPADGFDETEHAEADVQESIEIALIQMKGNTVQRVREALTRLDAGEYGYCAVCDGEISAPRRTSGAARTWYRRLLGEDRSEPLGRRVPALSDGTLLVRPFAGRAANCERKRP
jgi:RNA polymerase-binding transcription factor DksA